MNDPWDVIGDALLGRLREDIATVGWSPPTIAAARGDQPLLVIELRPEDDGPRESPLIEALALATTLGADRLAFAANARGWSLRDPIPPVIEGGPDLRQRCLVVELVDAYDRDDAVSRSIVVPFDLDDDGAPVWQERIEIEEEGIGWVPATLRVAATAGRYDPPDLEAARLQALRCVLKGHDVGLAPGVLRDLDLAPLVDR